MPSPFNPVSSNPISGTSHSKSLRSRLGFGGSTGNSSLVKPSFFSHLKSTRKSLVGPSELSIEDQTILLIDRGGVARNERMDARNMSFDDSTPRGQTKTKEQGSQSLSRATGSRIRHNVTHSLSSVSPDSLRGPAGEERSFTKITQNDPDNSGVSKQLPDISADHSLLLDEPLPSDTAFSRGGAHGSQESVINIDTPPDSMRDQNHAKPSFPDFQKTHAGAKATERSVTSPDTSARLSLDLDLASQDIAIPWSKQKSVQSNTVSSADSSALLNADESSLLPDGNAPITSTPFVSRRTSSARAMPQQSEEEVSFDLDALDPDLVALLRPNNLNDAANRVTTTSPSASLSPSSDPVNHRVTSPSISPRDVSRIPVKHASLSSQERRNNAMTALSPSQSPSPVRGIRPPRTYTTHDFSPPSHAPKPTNAGNHIPWLEKSPSEVAPPSSGQSTVSSSDLGTPSDASKQPSPMSTLPMTLVSSYQSSNSYLPWSNGSVSASHSSIPQKNRTYVPTRYSPIPDPAPAPPPVIDSRPPSRFVPRNREYGPTSTSPENLNSSLLSSLGRERDRTRPSLDAVINVQSNSASNIGRYRTNSNAILPQPRDHEQLEERRHRKRSMSLDESPNYANDTRPRGITRSRFTRLNDRRFTDSAGHTGSDYAYSVVDSASTAYDERELDKDRERYIYGSSDGQRMARPLHTDWLGPRTAKAFAAAGLLDERREITGIRSMMHSRNGSEREYRTPTLLGGRDRSSPMSSGFPSTESERDRDPSRFSGGTSIRSGERDLRSLGGRAGATSPSLLSSRPLSRADSWSNSRPAPVFARAISDLVSRRNSVDGRDSASSLHPRTTSTYSISPGHGESAGSGGGRASPTTTSSVFAQAQIQSMKEKHDSQTEALLAALADSQKICKELRSENEVLKGQTRDLEDRLAAAISSIREKDKELSRMRRLYSPDRTRTPNIKSTPKDYHQISRQSSPPKSAFRAVSPPKTRPISTSSSVFPNIPNTMSLLIAERPESPAQDFLESGASPPPSPTLVLSKVVQKKEGNHKPANESPRGSSQSAQVTSMTHKRSTSGVSVATSTNFSLGTGSPGSLKLKPEHELLLGDMTELSLITGFGEGSDLGH